MEKMKYIAGDLVRYSFNNEIYKISYIMPYGNNIYKLYATQDGNRHQCLECATLERIYEKVIPIPLTIEFLKNNGWKLTNHVVDEDDFEWYEYENDDNSLPEIRYYPKDDSPEGHFSVFWGDAEVLYVIRSVHELQHFMFGLDIEFEFKL